MQFVHTLGNIWYHRYDLPFTETTHIFNPLNEGKTVKICRDGTEIEQKAGMELCALIDNGAMKSDKKRLVVLQCDVLS